MWLDRLTLFPSRLLCVGLFVLAFLLDKSDSGQLASIYWNSSNPIFRVDNTDHVLTAKLLDRVNIMCPSYDAKKQPHHGQEYSKIYRVPRWDYDNCLLGDTAQIVGVCVTPQRRAKISLVFREFTPLPGGLEFKPGHSYFFISTSKGSFLGLSNARGGLCSSHNMKLKLEIQPSGLKSSESDVNSDRLPPQVQAPEPEWPSEENLVVDSDSSQGHSSASFSGRTPSPTPLLYIIHTRSPTDREDRQYEQNHGYRIADANDGEAMDDDGGSAGSVASALVVCLLLLLLRAFAPEP